MKHRIERAIRPRDEIPDFDKRFRLYRAHLSAGRAVENPLTGFVGGRWEDAGEFDTENPPEQDGRPIPLEEHLRGLARATGRAHRVAP